MGLSTHAENKYGHNQTNNTHKNKLKFLVNIDLGKTPSIFSGENLLESSSNLFIFQIQEKYICRQNKTTKYNLSLQPSLKTMPALPQFLCPLEVENLYCTDMIARTVLYRLYGFLYHNMDRTDFFFNFFSKTSLEWHAAHNIQCCSYCTFCCLLNLDFHAQLCPEITPSACCNKFLLQNFSPALSVLSPICS